MGKTVGHHLDDKEQEEIIKGLSVLLEPERVLEVGCGFRRFKPYFKHYTGIDKKEGIYADSLPFTSGEFDLVFSCTVLMHNEKIKLILQEMARTSSKWITLIEPYRKIKQCFLHEFIIKGFSLVLNLRLMTKRSPLALWIFKKGGNNDLV